MSSDSEFDWSEVPEDQEPPIDAAFGATNPDDDMADDDEDDALTPHGELEKLIVPALRNEEDSQGYGNWTFSFKYWAGRRSRLQKCFIRFNSSGVARPSFEKNVFYTIMRFLSGLSHLEVVKIENVSVIDFSTLCMTTANSGHRNPFPRLTKLVMTDTLQILYLKDTSRFPATLEEFSAPSMRPNRYLRAAFHTGTNLTCHAEEHHFDHDDPIRVTPIPYSQAKPVSVPANQLRWTGAGQNTAWVASDVYATPQYWERTLINRVKSWALRAWNWICNKCTKASKKCAAASGRARLFVAKAPSAIAKAFPKLHSAIAQLVMGCLFKVLQVFL